MSKIKKYLQLLQTEDMIVIVMTIMYWYSRNWVGTASYLQEMNRYLYGRLLEDIERR